MQPARVNFDLYLTAKAKRFPPLLPAPFPTVCFFLWSNLHLCKSDTPDTCHLAWAACSSSSSPSTWPDSPSHNYSSAAPPVTLAHARSQLLFLSPCPRRAAPGTPSHCFTSVPSNPLLPGSTLSFPGPLKNPRKGFRRDAALEEKEKTKTQKAPFLLCFFCLFHRMA